VETFSYDEHNRVIGTVRQGSGHRVSTTVSRDLDGYVTGRETRVTDGRVQSWTQRLQDEDGKQVTVSFFGPERAPLAGEWAVSEAQRAKFDDFSECQVDLRHIPMGELLTSWTQMGERGLHIRQVKIFDDLGRLSSLESILGSDHEIHIVRTFHYVEGAIWTHDQFGDDAHAVYARCEFNSENSARIRVGTFIPNTMAPVERLPADCRTPRAYDRLSDHRWVYDGAGHLREELYIPLSGERIQTTFDYQPGLHITRVDSDGDQRIDHTTHLYLDARSHPILELEDNDGDGKTDRQNRYGYDGDGNRVLAERDRNADGHPDTRWTYIYNENGVRNWAFKIELARRNCLGWIPLRSSAGDDVAHQ